MFKKIRYNRAKARAFLYNYNMYRKSYSYPFKEITKTKLFKLLIPSYILVNFFLAFCYIEGYKSTTMTLVYSVVYFVGYYYVIYYSYLKYKFSKTIKNLEFSTHEVYDMIKDGVDLNLGEVLSDMRPHMDNYLGNMIDTVDIAKRAEYETCNYSFNGKYSRFRKLEAFIDRKKRIEDVLIKSNNKDMFDCYNKVRSEKQKNIMNYLNLIDYIQGQLNTYKTKYFKDIKEDMKTVDSAEVKTKKGIFSKFASKIYDSWLKSIDELEDNGYVYLLSEYNKDIEKLSIQIRNTEEDLRNIISELEEKENKIEIMVLNGAFRNSYIKNDTKSAKMIIQETNAKLRAISEISSKLKDI